jgi:hypothetical protein
MSAIEPLMNKARQFVLKSEHVSCSSKSVAEPYLLAMVCPVFRSRDSHSGFRTERETLVDM